MRWLIGLALGLALTGVALAEEAAKLSETDRLTLRLLVTERELYRQAQRADRAEREIQIQVTNRAVDQFVRELAEREGFDLEEYQPNAMSGTWEKRRTP